MKIASILEGIKYGDIKPAVSVLINTPVTKEVRIVFREGQEMVEHKTGYPIIIAVVEGTIDFGVGLERVLLEKGMMVALEANVPHDLKAIQSSVVRLSLNKSDSVERLNTPTNS